ncbi:E3 ubiquitin-protein ligase RNF216 [Colletotrichum sp. SAR 10_70]|nr:E3 ubiquitin-protein ligase RNF216 [Colletotrichum sp. SAR 10_71]KAI8152382.1 E3 ubiquitin-protein ligase RNF216 [Colletotrichum sp. SAR 10_70]
MADIEANIKSDCAAQIFAVFPDICPEYFEKTATELLYDVDKIIEEILGASSYPKKARSKSLKRKRESPAEKDEVSKVRQLYDFANRPPERAQIYISISKKVLSQDFPRATIKSITKLLAEHNNCLMQTYLALDEITRDWKSGKTKARFEFKKTRTPPNPELEPANLDGTIRDSTTPDRTRALEELRAARQVCEAEQSRRNSARAKVLEEENNFKQAQEEGTIAECGCCFDEQPLNRMVHCDNPDAEHRAMFLDDKLQAALDRIEFEAALQAQGFENLSACPFCPYAADCPPVEEDKEFRGGKKGNCPLFEQTEVRHEKEVRQAEEEARQKVLAAKPKLNEGLLKFNMSEHVTKGEKKTRSMVSTRSEKL